MDITEKYTFDLYKIISINNIRLKLGAMLLFDIFDGNGTLIYLDLLKKTKNDKLINKGLLMNITSRDILAWKKFTLYLDSTFILVE